MNGGEEVHIISILQELGWREAAAGDASQVVTHSHAQWFDAEVIEDGGEGVALSQAQVKNVGGTQPAIDADPGMAPRSDIVDEGDEVIRDSSANSNKTPEISRVLQSFKVLKVRSPSPNIYRGK